MKAIKITDKQTLAWLDSEKPAHKEHEVLIKVAATAINRADLLQRAGRYPAPSGFSPILGLECAGEIVAVGKNCERYRKGDKVCALLAGGGYAEYAAVDEGSVLPVPNGLSMLQATAIPEVFATAWLNLFMEAGVRSGEKVVLHAGASGVGTAAIQLCRINEVKTFVTVGSEDKLEVCRQLGASDGVNRHESGFLEAARNFAPDGVNVILDPVGGDYLSDNIKLLSVNGRLVLIGLMGGARAELDLAALLMKRIRFIGSTLRPKPLNEKAEIMKQLEERVWPSLTSGEIVSPIEAVMPITDVVKGHELIASDQTIGKVILEINH